MSSLRRLESDQTNFARDIPREEPNPRKRFKLQKDQKNEENNAIKGRAAHNPRIITKYKPTSFIEPLKEVE